MKVAHISMHPAKCYGAVPLTQFIGGSSTGAPCGYDGRP